jgi:hypothetical protein
MLRALTINIDDNSFEHDNKFPLKVISRCFEAFHAIAT